jgi:hypothetical protein
MTNVQTPAHRFTPTVLLLCGGLLLWAADFIVIYCTAAVVCAKGYEHVQLFGLPLVTLLTLVATLLAGVATGVLIRRALAQLRMPEDGNGSESFIPYVALCVGGLGLLAILFNAVPALLIEGCGNLGPLGG